MTPSNGMSEHEWEAITSGLDRLETKVDNLANCFSAYKINMVRECAAKHEPINRILSLLTVKSLIVYSAALLITSEIIHVVGIEAIVKAIKLII